MAKQKSGIRTQVEQIIRTYYGDIYCFCRYKLHDPELAYDITQETFLKFIKSYESYSEQKKMKAYLLKIASNTIVDYYRRCNACGEYIQESCICEDFSDELIKKVDLDSVIALLPVEQQDVILLRYFSDMKLREIGEILGLNVATVKSRLKLAKHKIEKYITEGES